MFSASLRYYVDTSLTVEQTFLRRAIVLLRFRCITPVGNLFTNPANNNSGCSLPAGCLRFRLPILYSWEKDVMIAALQFVWNSVITPENAVCLLWALMFALGYRVYHSQKRA